VNTCCKITELKVTQQENGWIRNDKGEIIAVPVEWLERAQKANEEMTEKLYGPEERLKTAMQNLKFELKKSKEEGSYYYSWQANIAMAIRDNVKGSTHENANKAAREFLDILIRD